MAKFKVFLDAGHGGVDPGAVGHGLEEKNITLEVVKRSSEYISNYYPDIECVLARNDDQTVGLSTRTNLANREGCDCLVSIHVNSAWSSLANGFESYRYTTDGPNSKSIKLQNHLHDRLSRIWKKRGRRDRGMKKANFHMVREFNGASVLLELGFIVNKKDAEMLKDDRFLQTNAVNIAAGIAEYLGVTKSVTPPVRSLYRVLINGVQVGAYGEIGNVLNQVEKAAKAGENTINIQRLK